MFLNVIDNIDKSANLAIKSKNLELETVLFLFFIYVSSMGG